MNRIRLKTGPLAFFGAVFVVALVDFLPLRLTMGWFALGDTGLAAREVQGSVWAGSMREARFGDVALGDLDAGLSPLRLLLGRARIDLSGQSAAPERHVHGAIEVSRHSFGVDAMTAMLPTGDVFAPLPVSALDLSEVSLRFRDGSCERAEGRMRAMLSGDLAGVDLGHEMSGVARCDGGALLLPLTSQAGTESAALRLWNDGRFRAELTMQPSDAADIPKLVRNGFQPATNGYLLAIEGRF